MNASWVAIDLMEFAVRTEDAVQSPEAALEWLRSFRDTLLMEGRNSRPMPWAVELLGMADVKIAKKSIARMQGQIVKLFGKDCDVDLECSKKYGEKYENLKKILAAATTREGVDDFPDRESGTSERTNGCNQLTAAAATREGVDVASDRESGCLTRTTGCNPLTADAPTREDGEFKSDSGNAGNLESATSATHYGPRQAKNGDTATREGAEVVISRESGAAVPTTVSRNMRRVPQTEAPAHGFSGGRTAQGTMSRSPEAAAQSGKDYDKETSPAVAGANLDSHHTNKSPDASSGNAEGVNFNGSHNGRSRAVSTSATSGQTFEAPLRPGAGEVPPENVSAKPSPALPVPAKKAHGEFGNVLLTDDEFAKLQEKTTNALDLITELDQYIESQGKTRKYKSHYATLLNWSRRKDQESKTKNGYKTAAEKDADVLKELAEYYDKMEAV